MNRKGFTLVELLVTIAIIGIVLSLGTYFVMEVVENSKKKAYEATKKSALESAVIYANEFLDETDWVEVSDEIDTDRACVSIQWLINKGYVKNEDFNPSEIIEDYKLNTDHVVVLKKDTKTKTIRYDDVYKSEGIDISENGTCNNLLNAEIASTSTTTKSITVNSKCSIKNVIPSDIEYTYCIKDNNDINGKCDTTYNSIHTWSDLEHNSVYNISFSCESKEFGAADVDDFKVYTKELKAPSINVSSVNAAIDFEYFTGITRTYSVNKSGVKNYSNTLTANKPYTSDSKMVYLYGTSITEDVTITATNSDGKNNATITATIVAPEITTPNKIIVYPPQFKSSDEIRSGNWHKNKFNLSIESDNSSEVIYYYGTSINNLKEYTSEILISNETNSTTYYAKACSSNDLDNCSDHTSYIVKLDKTAPKLDIEVKNTDYRIIDLVQEGNKYTNDNWIKAKLNFSINAEDTGSGLSSNEVTFRYSPSKKKERKSLSGTHLISNGSTTAINEDGNRWYQFEICDIVGNCTIKDYFIKTDVTPPNLDAAMGYTSVSSSANLLSCSKNTCNNDNWLNKYVTLYFNSNDALSGLNNNAIFAYNSAYLSSLIMEELITEEAVFNNGSFIRNIYSDGDRYVTLNICDITGNCTEKKVYFKIDTVLPVVGVNKNGNDLSITCRPSFSGVKIFSLWDNNNNYNKQIADTIMTYTPSNSNNINIELTCRNNAELFTNETYEYNSSSGGSSNSNTFCDVLQDEDCCLRSCRDFKRADGTLPWKGIFKSANGRNSCYCCEPEVTDVNYSHGRCFIIT